MTNTLLTLRDPAAARRYYADRLWRERKLCAQLARAASHASRSASFAADDEAPPERAQRRFDLIEPRGVAAVEQPRHLRRLPAKARRQLFLVEARGAHRAIGFELGRRQGRQGDGRTAVCGRRQRHLLAVRHPAE